ncbi:pyridoxal 5'-phosphate synthase glutaminase subunit PdxT [candidate division KSB1 bacterium]|nr:pyridoxal 5'-phosphate synthase glutaminase subunit PdxT [candidate division KSB1 bacterium]
MNRIGVLALQGDFEKHKITLDTLGQHTVLVRTKKDLDICDGLVIPGGESTTLTKLLKKHQLWEKVYNFAVEKPVFGTCAGLIILSRQIVKEPVETLDLIDIVTERNAYGRQIDSFIDELDIKMSGMEYKFEGVFIRAPKIVSSGKNVTPLAWHRQNVVMVEQNNILAATFHPELTNDTRIHEYFLTKVKG